MDHYSPSIIKCETASLHTNLSHIENGWMQWFIGDALIFYPLYLSHIMGCTGSIKCSLDCTIPPVRLSSNGFNISPSQRTVWYCMAWQYYLIFPKCKKRISNVCIILSHLQKACIYSNPRTCKFFIKKWISWPYVAARRTGAGILY